MPTQRVLKKIGASFLGGKFLMLKQIKYFSRILIYIYVSDFIIISFPLSVCLHRPLSLLNTISNLHKKTKYGIDVKPT